MIASQSFHWFANTEALKEIHRVLVRHGLLGTVWAIPDYTVPWMAEIWEFFTPLFEEKSVFIPHGGEWKKVFNLPPRKLFSDLEENLSFHLSMPSTFDEAYNFLSNFSVIVSSSKSTKESFQKLFNEVMDKHFKDKGLIIDHVPFKILMFWCTKKVTSG